MAQPDEVWNFRRGDGFEKALLVANVLRGKGAAAMRLERTGEVSALFVGSRPCCSFPSIKTPAETTWLL